MLFHKSRWYLWLAETHVANFCKLLHVDASSLFTKARSSCQLMQNFEAAWIPVFGDATMPLFQSLQTKPLILMEVLEGLCLLVAFDANGEVIVQFCQVPQ